MNCHGVLGGQHLIEKCPDPTRELPDRLAVGPGVESPTADGVGSAADLPDELVDQCVDVLHLFPRAALLLDRVPSPLRLAWISLASLLDANVPGLFANLVVGSHQLYRRPQDLAHLPGGPNVAEAAVVVEILERLFHGLSQWCCLAP